MKDPSQAEYDSVVGMKLRSLAFVKSIFWQQLIKYRWYIGGIFYHTHNHITLDLVE